MVLQTNERVSESSWASHNCRALAHSSRQTSTPSPPTWIYCGETKSFRQLLITLTITYTNFRGMAVTCKVQFLSHLGGDQFDEREDGSDIGGRGGQR